MIVNVAIEKLHPHPSNPRKDVGDVSELAESIKAQGVLQNLTVVKCGTGKKKEQYTVVIGHRRLAASKIAGLTELPCIIADMDEHTQVATMLTENIQRNDLTVYEQAQGFQMMLDLGDSALDISKRTGFSSATIRRRLKLLELDMEKFAESVERGATLADYDALNKIEDIKARNKVLEKIGTDNFAWDLKSAISNQNRKKNKAVLLKTLKGFATKIKDSEASKYQYVKYISLDSGKIEIPDDAGTKQYYYTECSHSLTLYKEREKQEKPKKSPEEIQREETLKQIKGLFKQAYELRLAFAKSFTASGKMADAVDQKVIEVLFRTNNHINIDIFRAAFGIEKKFRSSWETKEKGESYEEALERIKENNYKTANTKMLFLGVYCRLENDTRHCLSWSGSLQYMPSKELEELYDFLIGLGYVMSDEEKALLDGSHDLYEAADPEEDDEEDYDDDEDDCDLCKSAHPSCDNCCAVCVDKCNLNQMCLKEQEEES